MNYFYTTILILLVTIMSVITNDHIDHATNKIIDTMNYNARVVMVDEMSTDDVIRDSVEFYIIYKGTRTKVLRHEIVEIE